MRIGLIGAGAVAPFHAAAARDLPGLELTAVCDLVPETAAVVAAQAGAATYTDHRAMLDSGPVDAVIVNTPHALHRPMVEDAAARGLHVLVEKPMAPTVADCDAMIDACVRAGVTLVVGHIQHFMDDKRALADVVAAGELGPVRAVHDLRGTDYRPGSRPAWFLTRAIAGGGVLMNLGAHCLDRTVWLGGGPATSVGAATVRRFGVEVETDALVTLLLASGVTASVNIVSGLPELDQLTVVCERGTLVADARRGAYASVDGTLRMLVALDPDEVALTAAFRRQLAAFAATVDGAPPPVTTAHARHVVALVTTAYEAATHGATLPVGDAR